MAKGSNANSDLYKKLHEEYGLELNIDFYLHPQSGSYIIKHNAVKKLVAKQREKGFIIETPAAEDIIIINDGTREGIHGKEVVLAGNFYLKNKDGVLIEKTYRTGEVNPKNCKNFYPHAMAEKRMYDRGVLDLLRFAQEGLYSDVEMDEFRQSAPKQKPSEPKQMRKKEVMASEPLPAITATTTMISAPKTPAPKTEDSKVKDAILNMLEENSEGLLKSEIWNSVEYSKEQINNTIEVLLESEKIYKSGTGRGVKYHSQLWREQEDKKQDKEEALTKNEYNDLWRNVSEELRSKGIEYLDLMKVVREVTGHDNMITAFKSGTLTKEDVEKIKEKGNKLCA